jgi:uncharacterized membrane protein
MINKERVLRRVGTIAIVLPAILLFITFVISKNYFSKNFIQLIILFSVIGIFLRVLSLRYRVKDSKKIAKKDKSKLKEVKIEEKIKEEKSEVSKEHKSFSYYLGKFIKGIGIIIVLFPFIILPFGILGMGIFSSFGGLIGIITGITFLSLLIPCIIIGSILIILGNFISRGSKQTVQIENVSEEKKEAKTEDEPLKVLKMRYAKGEISRKDFEQKKKDLEE